MGFFDKKYCDVCGEKIGLLGNRKLEDGNLCKECAKKLSPWFDERRHSTVSEIKEQIAYREENKEAVAAFHATRSFGRNYMIFLDEDNRKFVVATGKDLRSENPDVLDYSQVTGCDLDIDENRTELKREVKKSDGTINRVSYNPPRFEYSYDFYVIIQVNHPYFDKIRFKLNRNSVHVNNVPNQMGGNQMAGNQMAGMIGGVLNTMNNMMNNQGMNSNVMMPSQEYAEYYNMGLEIKNALLSVRQEVRDDIAAANAPKVAVVCPFCGATTTPNASGCCEYCGAPVN